MKKEYFYKLVNKNSIVNSKCLINYLESNGCKVSIKESYFVDAKEGNVVFMKNIPSEIEDKLINMTSKEIKESLTYFYEYTVRDVTLYVDFVSLGSEIIETLDKYIESFIKLYLTGNSHDRNVVLEAISIGGLQPND